MTEHEPTGSTPTPAPAETDYVRFIILSGPRTGSNMLAQALDSHSEITCFREVFNFLHDFVQYDVGGYDNFDERDVDMRAKEPVRFLAERIFGSHPDEVRAVGFKYHYGQFWGYPGLLERLVNDGDLRVIHLRRRNLLRRLASEKLAAATGVYMVNGRRQPLRARLLGAARRPRTTFRAVGRRLKRPRTAGRARPQRVTISPRELFDSVVRSRMVAANHDQLFGDHPQLTAWYEDLVEGGQQAYAEVQEFLEVEPHPLTVTLTQQNPGPLAQLIENYDDLYDAFRDTAEVAYFE